MKILAYDTETTGFPRGHDYTLPDMPHLAAVTGILYDTDKAYVISSVNLFVQPDNWSMLPDAAAVNGLTTEFLTEYGIPLPHVLRPFMYLANKADLCVAHNALFDQKIMSIGLWRWMNDYEESRTEEDAHYIVQQWQNIPQFCTQRESKAAVGALDKRGRIKAPKLTEAYQHFFGKELDKAHSTNADTVAVLEIFLALQEEE